MGSRVSAAAVTAAGTFSCRLPAASSIFTAEARAIMLALSFVESYHGDKFAIFSDSLSCLQAIRSHSPENPLIVTIRNKLVSLRENGKFVTLVWVPSHVGIQGNERADSAAKSALDFNVTNFKAYFKDFKPLINRHLKDRWQRAWTELALLNKLCKVMPELSEQEFVLGLSRKEQSVLARCRIGHTHLTHSYLLRGEEAPECVSCQAHLSVEHILVGCADFGNVRRRFYQVSNLSELFRRVPAKAIVLFLKDIGLFSKL